MPLYDYKCNEGHEFEVLIVSTQENVKCPDCGKKAKRRFPLPSPGRVEGGTPKHH